MQQVSNHVSSLTLLWKQGLIIVIASVTKGASCPVENPASSEEAELGSSILWVEIRKNNVCCIIASIYGAVQLSHSYVACF